MKLFYMPGACSLAPHIVACEAGLDLKIERVNTKEQRTEAGADFKAINPKGYVPTLQLDDGQILTEAAVVVQYLGDRKPEAKLIPAAGSLERYRVQEWLNFIATELHKGMGPLWNPATPAEFRAATVERLMGKFAFLDAQLQKGEYLTGSQFTVADAYLFTVTNWTGHLKLDLSAYPALLAFQKRVGARPGVQKALKDEGLLK